MMFGFQFWLIAFFVPVVGPIVIVLRIIILGMCKGFSIFSLIHLSFFSFRSAGLFFFFGSNFIPLFFVLFLKNHLVAGNEQRINQQTKWLPTNNDYEIEKMALNKIASPSSLYSSYKKNANFFSYPIDYGLVSQSPWNALDSIEASIFNCFFAYS